MGDVRSLICFGAVAVVAALVVTSVPAPAQGAERVLSLSSATPAAAAVEVSIGDAAVAEGDVGSRSLRFTLSLSVPSVHDVTVSYRTAGGDATPSDYIGKVGIATIRAGSTSTSIAVSVWGDLVPEAKEQFGIWLYQQTGAFLGRAVGIGRILDDDLSTGPKVAVGDASLVEGERGTRSLRFTISLSAASSSTVSVRYVTTDGSAAAGSDYSSRSGTATILAGATSVVVPVPIRPDLTVEDTESFTLTISTPLGARIARATGTAKILDDDITTGPPTGSTIAAGISHSCAIVAGGAIKCWGSNNLGELGNGSNFIYRSLPDSVVGITGATAITAGGAHSCVIVAGGAIKCWGLNNYGQLGNGTNTYSSNVPVSVIGITGATAITAGAFHACAIVAGGTVKCWGYNNPGGLGDGTNTNSNVAVSVIGITEATAITGGWGHSCAIVAGGAMKCWGWNLNGQLGDGTNTNSNVPVSVIGITEATAIAAGHSHSCAVVAGGAVNCWGYNNVGQLGNGTSTSINVPVSVIGITEATAIAAGYSHSCAIVAGGASKCWGYNYTGELGNGTNTNSNVPVSVIGISGAAAMATTYSHSCVIVAVGAIRCWGYNNVGQLGNGTTAPSNVPVWVSWIS